MKKKIIVLLLMLTFILSGCGVLPRRPSNRVPKSSENTVPTSSTEVSDTDPSTEESEVSPLSIGDTGILDIWSISVTDTEVTESIRTGKHTSFNADEGNQFFIVYLSIANNGKQASSFLPSLQLYNDVSVKILYLNEYEYSSSNLLGYDDDLHSAFMNPLTSRSGLIAFKLPDFVISSDDELILEFSAGKHKLLFKVR